MGAQRAGGDERHGAVIAVVGAARPNLLIP